VAGGGVAVLGSIELLMVGVAVWCQLTCHTTPSGQSCLNC
jgi:hypothetical protein